MVHPDRGALVHGVVLLGVCVGREVCVSGWVRLLVLAFAYWVWWHTVVWCGLERAPPFP
jgi:hypothetical protein